MRFVASKFDPATDPDRPVVGEITEVNGRHAKIVRVDHALQPEIATKVLAGEWYDAGDSADEVLQRDHAMRPGVAWLAWVKYEAIAKAEGRD